MKKIGFVVNPVAGMGGRVGLKGTDGVLDEAISRGATAVAPGKAVEMLSEFVSLRPEFSKDVVFVCCGGVMGEDELKEAGISSFEVVVEPASKTSASDTCRAVELFVERGVDLVVFCGGDGTARDVLSVVGDSVPMLGVPCGVKMHSAVFGVSTVAAARMLSEFLSGSLTLGEVEVMDLDEVRYRRGEWNIKLFGIARGIVEPTYVQVGKSTFEAVSDDAIKEEIAEHIEDMMKENPEALFLFGSGGTIDFVAKKLGFENTLLGVDAVAEGKVVGSDLDEKGMLELLGLYEKAVLLLSPIGAQGFILGRGNLQISPDVVRAVGLENIVVVSTPSKLVHTPVLRVDTGDRLLDEQFFEMEFVMVVIGYRLSRVSRIQRIEK